MITFPVPVTDRGIVKQPTGSASPTPCHKDRHRPLSARWPQTASLRCHACAAAVTWQRSQSAERGHAADALDRVEQLRSARPLGRVAREARQHEAPQPRPPPHGVHAATWSAVDTSHGHGRRPSAVSNTSLDVRSTGTSCTVASYAITLSAHMSCSGVIVMRRSAWTAAVTSGAAYNGVHLGHSVSPALAA